MAFATTKLLELTERGILPDPVVRLGIRWLLKKRLGSLPLADCESGAAYFDQFLIGMREGPAAMLADQANEQHYEVPAAFFGHVLGRHRKYSSGYWPDGVQSLDEAEALALAVTCERAGLSAGQKILELGCGWGSLTLWVAERYPDSHITAVSNSQSQRSCILAEADRRGLNNLEVITSDMNQFDIGHQFDRIISVEMFEHMRNWSMLFQRVHGWLKPGGKFFMHIFCHRALPYLFAVQDDSDWMSRHFFSGGMMPSDALPAFFQEHLTLNRQWRWNGRHYEKTANAWLANMDQRRDKIWPILAQTYGDQAASVWWNRWRIFFMACAELWGYARGREWWVSHYLFERPTK